MRNSISDQESQYKNPNEDSVVTSNSPGGKKVDADPDKESDKPTDESNLITQESQKGKKVDADPEKETDKPLAV